MGVILAIVHLDDEVLLISLRQEAFSTLLSPNPSVVVCLDHQRNLHHVEVEDKGGQIDQILLVGMEVFLYSHAQGETVVVGDDLPGAREVAIVVFPCHRHEMGVFFP